MFSVLMQSNSIRVSMVKTVCFGSQFERRYPIQLNGIISQSEYIESIDTINRKFGSGRRNVFIPSVLYCIIIILLIIILTTSTSIRKNYSNNKPIIFGTIFGAGVLMIILIVTLIYRRKAKLERAVSEESAKYSSRSPISCTWRIEAPKQSSVEHQNKKHQIHEIVIDVGRSSTNIPYDNRLYQIRRQENLDAPPSYLAATNGTCSQCRTVHTDPSTRNCSSCGQTLNKY